MTILICSILGFLILLANRQAADPNCEDLTKPRVLEADYSSILGKWIFTEGIANQTVFARMLTRLNSTLMEISHSSFRDTLIFCQGSNFNGNCVYETMNATFKSSTFYSSERGVTLKGDLLRSSSGVLTISLTRVIRNLTSNALYMLTRGPKASESELDLYWKQAECLGYRKEPQFSFDGVSEFCSLNQDLFICNPEDE